jgi:hypothetical protein
MNLWITEKQVIHEIHRLNNNKFKRWDIRN